MLNTFALAGVRRAARAVSLALAMALSGCGDSVKSDPTSPLVADPHAVAVLMPSEAAAKASLGDVVDRLVPSLADALPQGIARALDAANDRLQSDDLPAARAELLRAAAALDAYAANVPRGEGPELDAIRLALDSVAKAIGAQ